MIMKKNSLVALMALAAGTAFAATPADAPLWMRYPAISPDGSNIAFSYKGDIFVVPSAGGRARQITTNPAHDTQPVWSPDGRTIAFASDREGGFDIFTVSASGGVPRRLTTHSTNEYPMTFADNGHILYSAMMMPDVKDSQFPSATFPQVYKISTDGGRPELFSTVTMENVAISKDGKKILYHDKKGYEDPFRKHHTSSITRDIWLCEEGPARKFTKLTDFKGEDRNPVWSADGKSFYYLSEKNGSFNVYKRTLADKNATQLTKHTMHPVRNLSASDNDLLCYTYNGELYTLKPGSQPQKVAVEIIADKIDNEVRPRTDYSGVSSIAVSPNGKEVAFVHRGDVYVTSTDYQTTKRITDTPEQERNVDFAPDGKSIIYSSERDGIWGIYQTSLVRPDDKYLVYAKELKEKPLVKGERTAFQPKFSPDGKEVAFLEDRTELRVLNLASGKIRTVLPGKYNYSYSDGDQTYTWSPDGKWFLARYLDKGGWQNQDVVLVKADGSGEMTNLTESGYNDGDPKWVLGGKAMIWGSDRAGFRSHGSWGAESDVYAMFFDEEAWDKFRLSKEETEIADEIEKARKEEEKKAEEAASKDKKGKKESKAKEEDKTLRFDLENRRDRVARLTGNSSFLGDALLSPKADKLYYCAAFEGDYDLWVRDLKDGSTRILIKGVGGGELIPDKDMKHIYLSAGNGIKKIDIASGKVTPITFAAEYNYRPAQEREYIFEHAWRQVKDKFYDPEIHGIDWQAYHDAYKRFLPHINNNRDFQELLSEMLGELNGSHTGARFYGNSASVQLPAVASLGAFFDPNRKGDGLLIQEIIKGSPLRKAGSDITEGCIIEKIDGKEIKAGEDYFPMLAGKAGKQVLLSVYNPSTGKRFEQQVKPISSGRLSDMLYNRWVENKTNMVKELSNGKVGYIHVQGMNSESFRKTYSDLLGKFRHCDAIIIDTRHNGGGWLHEDLAILLSGTKFAEFTPRGKYVGDDPFNRWTKPSCVLVCEDNYSNAHGFPWTYQTLGIGKLIGTPVPGTMTAVWWENQIDPSIVFGIPQVGMKDMKGRYLENLDLIPEIEIYNSPESQINGEDLQLVRAVQEMLSQTKK